MLEGEKKQIEGTIFHIIKQIALQTSAVGKLAKEFRINLPFGH